MELFVLCFVGTFIAYSVEKKSELFVISHSILFAFLLSLSLFTADNAFVSSSIKYLVGAEWYDILSYAFTEPCIYMYSTSFALVFIEIVSSLIIMLYAARKAIKHICRKIKKEIHKRYERLKPIFVRFEEFSTERIFLKLCRLLN